MKFELMKSSHAKTIDPYYSLEVTFMHGDADHYSTETVEVSPDKIDVLEEIIQVLDECFALPWNDARETYETLPGVKKFFGSDYLGPYDGEEADDDEWPEDLTYEIWKETSSLGFEWPNDITCEEVWARLNGYDLFYYDENRVKHRVNIIKD